jgi:hypothetical protein
MTANLLPFPRGSTWSDYANSGITLSDTEPPADLEGKVFGPLPDTKHGTAHDVYLRVVKNDLDSDLDVSTYANTCLEFSATTAKDFGARAVVTPTSEGGLAKPIDDAYDSTGQDIPAYDLFYVVEAGPCNVMMASGAQNQGVPQMADTAGALKAATGTNYVVGTLLAGTAGSVVALVLVQAGIVDVAI